jgi:hypothetical protein
LFVDLDDTLLLPGRFSRTMWRLARFFQNRGRDRQRPNPLVLQAMRQYGRVVIVTSRDVSDRERTLRLLAKHGVHIPQAQFCPRQEVFKDWKGRVIAETAPDGPVAWMDDLFDPTGPVTLRLGGGGVEVHGLPVPRASGAVPSGNAEPPSL